MAHNNKKSNAKKNQLDIFVFLLSTNKKKVKKYSYLWIFVQFFWSGVVIFYLGGGEADDYSGHYVIASSRPPECQTLERRTLVPMV